MKKIWPFTFYFWQYAAVAFMAPFTVLFYQQLGFSGAQIGLMTGLYPLVTLFSTPIWTGMADAFRRHRLALSLALAGGSIIIFAIPLFSIFLPVLVMVVLSSMFLAPVSSLADSATLASLGEERTMYGRLRLGGTVGFAIAAPVAGQLVQTYGIRVAFWGGALMYIFCLLASQKFSYTEPAEGQVHFSFETVLRELLQNPRWLLFLAGALAGGIALATSNSYFFPYLKELGAGETTMGLALTVGTIGEVPVMFFGNRLLKRLGSYPLFMFSLLITALRLALFAIATNPTQALFINLLNGLTFPAMWLAGVAFADEHAPVGMSATAQGIFGAVVFGIGTALGGFLGGALLGSIGAKAMTGVFAVITFALVGLVLAAGRFLPMGREKPGLAGKGL